MQHPPHPPNGGVRDAGAGRSRKRRQVVDYLVYMFLGVWLVTFLCLFRIRPVVARTMPNRPRRPTSTLRLLPPLKQRQAGDDSKAA